MANPQQVKDKLAELVGQRVRVTHRDWPGAVPSAMVGRLKEVPGLAGWYAIGDAVVTYGCDVALPWHGVEDVEAEPAEGAPAEPALAESAPAEPAGPKLYTLEEARAEMARRECTAHGHDFEHIIDTRTADPVRLFCPRCKTTWTVSVAGGQ
ncbi:hypothetical protein ACQP25_44365 (plasmid) [Microtetraspora malaysiensis]|uniref:hypothetical protein n=1 Tax=Microtetraspora malaysiensis TaxID=161358 RepID=UPI003D8BC794